jgi:hypothetical protein
MSKLQGALDNSRLIEILPNLKDIFDAVLKEVKPRNAKPTDFNSEDLCQSR